jgi:hypothetical protein
LIFLLNCIKIQQQRLFVIRRKKKQQALFDAGALPCFPIETTNIREQLACISNNGDADHSNLTIPIVMAMAPKRG